MPQAVNNNNKRSENGQGQQVGNSRIEDSGNERTGFGGGLFGSHTPGPRFILAVLFLMAAIVYTIWPVDIIPDILGPIGWIDDAAIWLVVIILGLTM